MASAVVTWFKTKPCGVRGGRIPIVKTMKEITDDYFHRHEKVYSPVQKNQIKLVLYDGPNNDSYQNKSVEKTKQWVNFFDQSIYQKYITREYYNSIGLPLGIVYNHKKNEIKTFDCHLELDEYFRDNYN